MNQILCTKENNNMHNSSNDNYLLQQSPRKKTLKNFFKLQFIMSTILIFATVTGYLFSIYFRNMKENISQKIANNYDILKLYNDNTPKTTTYQENGQTFSVIGMIEVPKINIYYPIISESNDELLKIAPCRVSGPMPNEDGNLCIAGHNYDNYKFFSKLSNLNIDDEIIIHDGVGNKIVYYVFNIYEVSANNLSPLSSSEKFKKQVTLITCNNSNSNRLIIEATPK